MCEKTIKYLLVSVLLFMSMWTQTTAQKSSTAVRISSSIKVDGELDEAAWQEAEPATDFLTFEPVPYGEPTGRSEVRILYDDSGIYFGAHLYQDPTTILRELSARDRRGNADWFGVTLDPFQGGLNGFSFLVTVSGVQQDLQFSSGQEDSSWEAVWQSEVRTVDDGWIVEMKIPYMALRFPKEDVQQWNMQLARGIRYIRENSFWQPLDPQIDGFINQCGVLNGIENIKSPVRLSLTPFVVGYLDHNSANTAGDQTSTAFGAGMDLKYGINDAFTLDMTLIPDFGAVVSDNVVVNLGPFEQFFEENRAFFTEGIELFNKGNLFYTRRIGGRPLKYGQVQNELLLDEQITDNSTTTQLLNATKVSGRTAGGTGIGVFNAVVDRQVATVTNQLTGGTRGVETNPVTNYNVVVVDQNLANNSVVSLVNTSTLRFGSDYDANVTGLFADLRDKSQQYGLAGKMVVSQKYYEDQDTDLGHSYFVSAGKVGGRWRAVANYVVESENYDHNDLGFLFSPNEQGYSLDLSYNEFKPKNQKLVRYRLYLNPYYERLYKPNVFTKFSIETGGFMLYKSRVGVGGEISVEPIATRDYFETRTADFSKYYRFPTNFTVSGFISSDYRKPFAYDVRLAYRSYSEQGRYELSGEFEPRVRFSNKLSLFGTLSLGTLPNQIGYVSSTIPTAPIPGIGADDVMFGRRDRVIFDNSLRLNYIFTPTMSVSLRARHYWDQFTYNRYSRVEDDGSLTRLAFDGLREDGSSYYDTNFNIFNIDLFYTWRFAPGSDIIFAWKNAISTANADFDSRYFRNLADTFGSDQFNSFSLRIIYFLDYNTVVGDTR